MTRLIRLFGSPRAALAQGLCLLTLVAALTGVATGWIGPTVLGVLVAAQLAAALPVFREAARATLGTRHAIFFGMFGWAAVALIGQLVWVAGGLAGSRVVPAGAAGAIGVCAQLALLGGLSSALGRTRSWMRFEALSDALLLVVAAAILVVLTNDAAAFSGAESWGTRLASVAWSTLSAGNLILVALLLAWRGERLGRRGAGGLALGMVALAMGNLFFAQAALPDPGRLEIVVALLWTSATAFWVWAARPASSAMPLTGELPVYASDGARIRIAAIVVAILIASGSAVALGFQTEPRPALAATVGLFGALLAVRVGHALWMQANATRALETTVEAEREVTQTLEHRVAARTSELAEAQRVLQRMWSLSQQIALELHPERVLQRFIEGVVDVAHADGGYVALVGHDERLQVAFAAGVAAPLHGRIFSQDGSAMGEVVRSGKAWRQADVQTQAVRDSVPNCPARDLGTVRGAVMLPLIRRGARVGAVAVVSRQQRYFTDVELSRLETLTDLFSVALANAELVETLRQAEWRFRTLFRAAPDAVLTMLESGRIREANDAVRDISGLYPMQVVGTTLESLLHPDDRERARRELARAFSGAPARFEARFVAEGSTRTVSLAARLLPEAEPPTVLCVGRDITAEREMRGRLAETERLAAVGELVAGVAHEVNNPLSTISAFAQLMLRDEGLTADQRDSVEVMRAETTRASQVVRDLLTFARRSESQRGLLELNEIVERTVRLRGYEMTSRQVQVEMTLADDLPHVLGDGRQLQQVVLNLVTNAMQAMADVGGTLRIATRAERGQVVLEVADGGTGIPEAVRPHIFEPFFTTKGEGTGLGLSVSYGIVTAHGGTITVAATGPTGTTFRVALPLAADEGAAHRVSGEHRPLVERSPLEGLRLLFVDDEPSLRSGMRAFGRIRNITVETAENGALALDLIRREPFDAIVCDLRMPDMGGAELYAALLIEQPALAARTVFVTGDVVSPESRAFLDTVRQPVLAKPFEFERLEAALAEVLEGTALPLPLPLGA